MWNCASVCGSEVPPSWTDPLMYQGGPDLFVGPRDPIDAIPEDWALTWRLRWPWSRVICPWRWQWVSAKIHWWKGMDSDHRNGAETA